MKAKLKVLAAVSHKAKLLILDEPTSGLDVGAREDILDMLRYLFCNIGCYSVFFERRVHKSMGDNDTDSP